MGRLMTIAAVLSCAALPSGAASVKARPVPSAEKRIEAAVDALYKQSDVFFHEGEYEAAVFCYETLVGLDPKDIEAWTNYGWLLWSGMDRREDSRRVLERAIACNPETWEVYGEMGNLLYHYRDFLGAAAWFSKAMGRGAPWTVWHQRAHSLEYAGRQKQCVETWEAIVRKFPNNDPAKLNLKRVKEGRFRKEPFIGVVPKPGTEKPSPEELAEPEPPSEPPIPGSI